MKKWFWCFLLAFLLGYLNKSAFSQSDASGISERLNNAESQLKSEFVVGIPVRSGFNDTSGISIPKGLVPKVLQQISHDLSISFKLIQGSKHELLNALKLNHIDAIAGVHENEVYTQGFEAQPFPLITVWSELYLERDAAFRGPGELISKKVGLVRNDVHTNEFLAYILPFNLRFDTIWFPTREAGLKSLLSDSIYALPGPSLQHVNNKYVDIKSSGIYFHPNHLTILFNDGANAGLKGRLDSLFQGYTENPGSDYTLLVNEYTRVGYQNNFTNYFPFWFRLAAILTFPALLIVIIFALVLRRQVSSRTSALKEREIYLRKAMEAGKMGAWNINFLNDKITLSLEALMLCGDESINNSTYSSFFKFILKEEDYLRVIHLIQLGKQDAGVIDLETPLKNGQDKSQYRRLTGVYETDKAGKVIRLSGIIQDITSQKSYEKELISAKEKAEESEQLKSAFLANMSHEIRTPLNAIVGFSDLIASDNIPQEKRPHISRIISRQKDLLLTLISDIIDIAKLESGTLEYNNEDVTDIRLLIDTVYETCKDQCPEHVRFIKKLDMRGMKLKIQVDNIRLKQILINFVSNAFKHTLTGKVEMGFTRNWERKELIFYVEDTGTGISEQMQEKIFNRFHKLDNLTQGAGLGLSICQSLAGFMGGRIEVASTPGQGSTFSLALKDSLVTNEDPLDEMMENTKDFQEKHKDTLNGMNILIAEDIYSNYYLMESILQDTGANLTWAKNGLEAIEEVEQKEFDMVLMDLKMPKMNGMEAASAIKEKKKNVPILAVTAFALSLDEEKALNAGCDGYIAKPVTKDDLIRKIVSLL